MASEVDIANLALSHLGDSATVASLDPPEGSAQAEHCARFYPIARDSLLELHNWKFATRRATLAQLSVDSGPWAFAYAVPADALKMLAVLPSGAASDADSEDYEPEVVETGASAILTNCELATLRYIALVTDTTKFSPLFELALSWQLASFLAGPILKGDAGAAEAKRCAGVAMAHLSQAAISDANQRRVTPTHNVPWLAR